MYEKPTYEELARRLRDLEEAENVRCKTEAALQESERRLSTLVANLQGMVYSCLNDSKWTMKYLSNGAIDLTGYLPEELLDNRDLCYNDLIHPEDRQRIWEVVQASLEDKSDFTLEYRIIARNGAVKWVWERGNGVFSPEGELIALEGFVSDITERKRVEVALLESEARVKAMLKAVPDMMFRLSRDGVILDYKAEITELYIQNVPILGKPIRTLGDMIFAELVESKIRDTLAEGRTQLFEYQLPIPGIGMRQYEGRMAPSGPDEVTAIVRDITQRKISETEILRLRKSESLGRMAGAIAHNYNNLLFTVMGNLEMALLDLPEECEAARGLQAAMIAARRASEISNLMLAYLGQKVAKREPMDFIGACRELMPHLRADVPLYVTFKHNITDSGCTIDGNGAQIEQLIRNLVLNAWEALNEKPGTVSIDVDRVLTGNIPSLRRWPVEFKTGDVDYVCLAVADSGCGMSEDVIEKLFDPFFSTKFTGRGLGLAVVLGTVKAHGGCITVESEPGRGSTFRVYLPLAGSQIVSREEPAVSFTHQRTVMVVDDDSTVRKMAAMMLTHLGMKVLEAKSGLEALQIMREHPDKIHCVLCDMTMPQMDGWKTLEALREIDPAIPVVMASGYDQARVMQGDHSQLPQAFLGKPYTIGVLKKAMAKAMEGDTDGKKVE